jgi:hypothetical protein
LLPGLCKPNRLGELRVAKFVGEQHHASPAFYRAELLLIASGKHLVPVRGRVLCDVGHVGGRHHRGLVEQQQRAAWQVRADAARATLVREVAEE